MENEEKIEKLLTEKGISWNEFVRQIRIKYPTISAYYIWNTIKGRYKSTLSQQLIQEILTTDKPNDD